MEIETRMGFKVRSKYEDVVAWIQSDPPGVPYPKNRKELQAMDSHVYGQLPASLSTEATRTVADDFYRNRGGGGGGGGGGGRAGPPRTARAAWPTWRKGPARLRPHRQAGPTGPTWRQRRSWAHEAAGAARPPQNCSPGPHGP